MDPSSAEVTAARVVAVFVFERFVRARTSLVLWGAVALAALLWIGAFTSDGVGAVLLGLLALVATTVAATLFAARWLVLRAVGRVGGGPDYARLRPLVASRVAAVEDARTVIPLEPRSVVRLAWAARRPRVLREQIRDAADTISRTVPEVVADVRRELARPTINV